MPLTKIAVCYSDQDCKMIYLRGRIYILFCKKAVVHGDIVDIKEAIS